MTRKTLTWTWSWSRSRRELLLACLDVDRRPRVEITRGRGDAPLLRRARLGRAAHHLVTLLLVDTPLRCVARVLDQHLREMLAGLRAALLARPLRGLLSRSG